MWRAEKKAGDVCNSSGTCEISRGEELRTNGSCPAGRMVAALGRSHTTSPVRDTVRLLAEKIYYFHCSFVFFLTFNSVSGFSKCIFDMYKAIKVDFVFFSFWKTLFLKYFFLKKSFLFNFGLLTCINCF